MLAHLKPKTLAIKLTGAGERSLRKRHPWIFSESIDKCNKKGEAGDIAVIFSRKSNTVLGIGLFDPSSPIRIKLIHFGGGSKLNAAFFEEKIIKAFALRVLLLQANTNSYRFIFGENDGFPSLIADVYDEVLVLKLYSPIWWPWLNIIIPLLQTYSECKTMVLRLSRNLQRSINPSYPQEGSILIGELKDENIVFKEHGIRFSANVIHGHKTGYFLDHRHNRKRVGELSKGKRVLDVFAYAGGFSVHALVGGAKEVKSLDISKQALETAKVNANLNDYKGIHTVIAADAFEAMHEMVEEGEKFDLIIIDPPSFAKRATEIDGALKKYRELALLGSLLIAKNGILLLASCSSRVTSESFFELNADTLNKTDRKWSLLDKTFHDIDHPINFLEGAYLKCGYYKFD